MLRRPYSFSGGLEIESFFPKILTNDSLRTDEAELSDSFLRAALLLHEDGVNETFFFSWVECLEVCSRHLWDSCIRGGIASAGRLIPWEDIQDLTEEGLMRYTFFNALARM